MTLVVDKGWMGGVNNSYVNTLAIKAVRVNARAATTGPAWDVDALVEGQWITLATYPEQEAAASRVGDVMKEMRQLFKY